MNSIEQLNGFGNTSVLYFDNDANTSFTLSAITSPVYLVKRTGETQVRMTPGVNVTSANVVPLASTYTIDTKDTPITVTWDGLPLQYFSSSKPSTNAYRVTGPMTVGNWDAIGDPLINFPANYRTPQLMTGNLYMDAGNVATFNILTLYDAVYSSTFANNAAGNTLTEAHIQGGSRYRLLANGADFPGPNALTSPYPNGAPSANFVDNCAYTTWTGTWSGGNYTFTLDGNNTTDGCGSNQVTANITATTNGNVTNTSGNYTFYVQRENIGGLAWIGRTNGVPGYNGVPRGTITLVSRFPASNATVINSTWRCQNLHYRVEYRNSEFTAHGNVGNVLIECTRLNQWWLNYMGYASYSGGQFVVGPSGYHGFSSYGLNTGFYGIADNIKPNGVAVAFYRSGHRTDYPIDSSFPNWPTAGGPTPAALSGWTTIATSPGISASTVQVSPTDITGNMTAGPAANVNGTLTFDFTVSVAYKSADLVGNNAPAICQIQLVKPNCPPWPYEIFPGWSNAWMTALSTSTTLNQ